MYNEKNFLPREKRPDIVIVQWELSPEFSYGSMLNDLEK